MFKTVLLPIDQSREAREAADLALNIAKTHQANLVILAVVEPDEETTGEPPHSEKMTSQEAVQKLLTEAQAMFENAGVTAKTLQREGKPAFTICDVADEIEADLIIIGSRGMGLAEEKAADSVTNRVINLSPCPILVVP